MPARPVRPVRPKRRADHVPRLHDDAWGGWHWKPEARLRPAWRNVALGKHKEPARIEARRLNREVEAWLAKQAEGRPAKSRVRSGPKSVGQIIGLFTAPTSTAWKKLRPRTQAQYTYELARLHDAFGHDAAAMLEASRVSEWMEDLAFRSPEMARHLASCGRALFSWAMRTGQVVRADNPFANLRLQGGRKRRFRFLWPDIAHILAVAEAEGRPSVGVALAIAFASVQRISDVIEFHDGLLQPGLDGRARLVFDQSKRKKIGKAGALEARVRIDMLVPELVRDILAKHPPTLCRRAGEPESAARRYWIVSEETGEPYHEKTIARVFARVLAAAIKTDRKAWVHLAGGQLRDGRRSGFVHRIVQGAKVPQVTAISGHSLQEGFDIIEHYLPPTQELADQADAFLTVRL